MMPDGSIALGGGVSGPHYRSLMLALQPLPWLEATLHETYWPQGAAMSVPIEGGIGLKAGLSAESRWWPSLAVGVRDLAGGRFSSEYLVAAKRWYALDFSFGLGWGRLGESGGLVNPLNAAGGRYHRPREPLTQPAGPPSWFTGGAIAPFGGVSWQTPLEGLVLKLEVSSDRRQLDRSQDPGQTIGTPVNIGLSWHPFEWLELGAGFEHGRQAMARATLMINGNDIKVPRAQALELPQATPSVVVYGSRAISWLEPDRDLGDAYPPGQVIGRALRQMAERAPEGVEEVTVVANARGLDGVAVSALTREVRQAGRGLGSAPEIRQSGRIEPGVSVSQQAPLPDGWRPETAPPWRIRVNPRYQQSSFESLEPVVYRLGFDVESELDVTPGLVFSHTIRTTISHNLQALDATLVRSLVPFRPAVRSDLAWYVTSAPVNALDRLAVSWLAQPAQEVTTRIGAGWLEEMYAGLSGEMLYRPWQRRWALGVEVDAVRKRFPGLNLALESHTEVISGFGSLYYQTANGHIDCALHVGRYLGGDDGATFELNRRFDNGMKLGGWLTGTNGANRLGIEAPQHRDRYDGGLRLSFPLGAVPFVPSASRFEFEFLPLGRDSGQRADIPLRLEPLTRSSSYGAVNGSWGRLLD